MRAHFKCARAFADREANAAFVAKLREILRSHTSHCDRIRRLIAKQNGSDIFFRVMNQLEHEGRFVCLAAARRTILINLAGVDDFHGTLG